MGNNRQEMLFPCEIASIDFLSISFDPQEEVSGSPDIKGNRGDTRGLNPPRIADLTPVLQQFATLATITNTTQVD